MSRHLKISAVLACCVLLFASMAQAKGPKYTDPAKTDADFTFQGEYRGEIDADGNKIKIGVQVIALGEGKFRSISYNGGLPGDGLGSEIVTSPAGGQEKRGMLGELKDGVVVFDDDHAHEYDQAIKDFTEAIRLKPDDGYAYHFRGYAYQERGLKANAAADFAKAKELGYEP